MNIAAEFNQLKAEIIALRRSFLPSFANKRGKIPYRFQVALPSRQAMSDRRYILPHHRRNRPGRFAQNQLHRPQLVDLQRRNASAMSCSARSAQRVPAARIDERVADSEGAMLSAVRGRETRRHGR
jgi:hypothetical protein